MADFTVLIPGQAPSTNHSYARSKIGKVYKVAGVESYQTTAAMLVRLAKPKGWEPTRRIVVEYRMWLDSPRRDASNCLKALEDSIAIALGVNDNTFLPRVMLKEWDRNNPRVEIIVRTIDE
jgi:Holliday junction resolvase RusA-like endonuclease